MVVNVKPVLRTCERKSWVIRDRELRSSRVALTQRTRPSFLSGLPIGMENNRVRAQICQLFRIDRWIDRREKSREFAALHRPGMRPTNHLFYPVANELQDRDRV